MLPVAFRNAGSNPTHVFSPDVPLYTGRVRFLSVGPTVLCLHRGLWPARSRICGSIEPVRPLLQPKVSMPVDGCPLNPRCEWTCPPNKKLKYSDQIDASWGRLCCGCVPESSDFGLVVPSKSKLRVFHCSVKVNGLSNGDDYWFERILTEITHSSLWWELGFHSAAPTSYLLCLGNFVTLSASKSSKFRIAMYLRLKNYIHIFNHRSWCILYFLLWFFFMRNSSQGSFWNFSNVASFLCTEINELVQQLRTIRKGNKF